MTLWLTLWQKQQWSRRNLPHKLAKLEQNGGISWKLEQRKKTEEARAEAEELRRRVKQLEEQRNKALVEANSGKKSAKSSEKSVTFNSIQISARY
jgi:hypothetical protein